MRAPLHLAFAVMITFCACGCSILRDHKGPTAYVGDASISARLEIALTQSPAVKAQEIDVHTFQGTVTLDGVVDNALMARRAEQIARATAGVRIVNSRLQVAGPARPSDAVGPAQPLRQALAQ